MSEETQLLNVWTDLHELAAVSFKEHKTTAYLLKFFKKEGFTPVQFKNIPGFYVEMCLSKSIIGLRVDMDVLMKNVDGVIQTNHSCGHDVHMIIVLGVMKRLKQVEIELIGTFRAIFLRAEVLGNGSVEVIKEGFIED